MASHSSSPLLALIVSRVKLFLREPAAIFWVYGFPVVMMAALGTAFREDVNEEIRVDLVADQSQVQKTASGGHEPAEVTATAPKSLLALRDRLTHDPRIHIATLPGEDWQKRLQAGKTDLVIEVFGNGDDYRLWDEPHRTESRLARYAVEAALLRRSDSENSVRRPEEKHLENPGSRYIDFLLPGMIGMGLMGGGLWGVGFVIVDMRVRKLLKRFLATPMRRSDFLLAVMCSRLIFTLADVVILLFFGYLCFDVRNRGSYLDLTVVALIGAAAFAGIGLLVASRAQTMETVSGLMNIVMLPMWIFSGVFFSSERFPEVAQPLINVLPLTALNQGLRGVMLEGQSIVALWPQIAILATYVIVTFTIALRVFRWR